MNKERAILMDAIRKGSDYRVSSSEAIRLIRTYNMECGYPDEVFLPSREHMVRMNDVRAQKVYGLLSECVEYCSVKMLLRLF
ncbi:MAG: hypothetical protein ABR981_00645 [Candidatus Micrarchaeaceae archaeon]|jgi:hypothetical protein